MKPIDLRIEADYIFPREQVKINVPLIEFEEDGVQIIYCPSLDIQGYGNDNKEARDSFAIALEEFLKYTIHKNTLFSEMKKMGWKIKSKNKPMIPPDLSDSLKKNENFTRIFNQHNFRKYNAEIPMPVA